MDDSKLVSKLTKEYGRVHCLSPVELKQEIHSFGLNSRGTVQVLQKRLKEHLRRQQAVLHPEITIWQKTQRHSYYAVLDFEATCDDNSPETDFMHEIIEIPIILVSTNTAEIVDIFHEYVKPKMCPLLSNFCKELTGIHQTVINQSRCFTEVWGDMERWLGDRTDSICFITDGPWDMKKFLAKECRYNNIQFPEMCMKYCNIRRKFCNFYGVKRANISGMLRFLGLEFEGEPHSGICDSRNIARIVCTMIRDGAVLTFNEVVDPTETHFS